MKKIVPMSIMLFLLLFTTPHAYAHDSVSNSKLVGTVVKVIDGDTLKLRVSGWVGNYRLAAVDTPETYNNRKAKKDIIKCDIDKEVMFTAGDLATLYVAEMYPVGSKVKFNIVDIGFYGRPIIWVDDLIKGLASSGYVRIMDYDNIAPDIMADLRVRVKEAKDADIGIWKTLGCWK